jgi:hypothetical protein
MIYFKWEKFWTVAKWYKWSNPRPQYCADLKTTFLAALRTMPILGGYRKPLEAGCLHILCMIGWSPGATRQALHILCAVSHATLSTMNSAVSDCASIVVAFINHDSFMLSGGTVTCH